MLNKNKDFIIKDNETIKNALAKLNLTLTGCLIVENSKQHIVGTLTNGDLRRYLIKKPNTSTKVKLACNKKFFFIKKEIPKFKIKNLLIKKRIPLLPLIENKKVIKCFFLNDFLKSKIDVQNLLTKNYDAVVMAGGLGTRLSPFSDILPKPLVPLNGKPVIDTIIEKFLSTGIDQIFLTLNYKKNIIKSYLKDQYKKKKFQYINEKKRLGTASSLQFIPDRTKKNLIVSNCDTILKINFQELIKYHEDEKNNLTLVAAIKDFKIPYGICVSTKYNLLKKIKEKPTLKILANTGTYIINNNLLKFIPRKDHYDMNIFIENLMKKKFKIGIYPIEDKDWIDTGDWKNFNNSKL